jgi:hypothetical protein
LVVRLEHGEDSVHSSPGRLQLKLSHHITEAPDLFD